MEFLQAKDEGTLFWFETHSQPWLTVLMRVFTFLGEPSTGGVVVLLGVAGFWLAGRKRTACIVLATALLAGGLIEGVKRVVNRPRPDVAWKRAERPNQPSFPSGHSLGSMAVYGAIALLASRGLQRWSLRYLVIAAGLGLPLLIGISRPYLGVHYPSDVLGGWTAGLACALLAYWADQRWGVPAGHPPREAQQKWKLSPPAASAPEQVTRPLEGYHRPGS